MRLTWDHAAEKDLGLLADWNQQLMADEGHRNSMTAEQLTERMKGWLQGEYQAVVFAMDGAPVGYVLYTKEPMSIYLRQMFVRRDRRREGIGRAAFTILQKHIWPNGFRLTVDVLCANHEAVEFWRSLGYRDYSLMMEIMPESERGSLA